MIDLWRTWWPVILLMYVPNLVQSVMMIVVTRGFRGIDESHPDDLPQTAGDWVVGEIARLGFAEQIHVITTDPATHQARDAYHVKHATIQLSPETYFKRDPMHWAIAAHELGHAQFRIKMPLIGELLIAFRIVSSFVVAVGIALALCNTVFALPGVTELAFKLLVAGALMHLGVLIDEAVASLLAMRSLGASNHYAFTHLRSARKVLALAYSTYLVSFITAVLLLTQWWRLAELSLTPAVPPTAALTTLGTIAAIIMSAYVALYCLTRAVAVVSPLRMAEKPLLKVTFEAALVVFVLLVWNARADADYAYRVILAVIPISGWFLAVFMLPTAVVGAFLQGYLKRWRVDPTERTEEFRRDHSAAEGMVARKRGTQALTALIERSHDVYPKYGLRMVALLRLTPVPLLIAYWLG